MENTSVIQRGGRKAQNFRNNQPLHIIAGAKENCFWLRELVEQNKAGRGYFGHNGRRHRKYMVCKAPKRHRERGNAKVNVVIEETRRTEKAGSTQNQV